MLPTSASSLLPQQFPFQMVDTFSHADEGQFKSVFTGCDDNIMLCDGLFTEGGLIENMAQTAACGTGYLYASQGKEVPVGYIGALKHVNIARNPEIGEVLETEVVIKNQIGGASIAAAKVVCAAIEIASCELTIFIQS